MRTAIVIVLMVTGLAAQAQDGAHMMTLSEVKHRRAELAGMFVRIEKVTISGFSMSRGGVATDGTGTVRIDDVGMPSDTISYLERHCAQPGASASHPGCRGALEFTVDAAQRGAFTISDAQFVPQD